MGSLAGDGAQRRRGEGRVARLWRNLAVHDLCVLALHGYLLARALGAGEGEAADRARRLFAVLLASTLVAIVLTRAEWLPAGKLRAAIYRAGVVLPVPLSYGGLADLSAALRPAFMDHGLFAIDRAFLGTTPALWLARFNTVAVNEWFSCFYESYYGLLAVGLLLPPLFERGQRLQEVMLGAALVGAIGQALYTLVPGMGPHSILAFAEPVHGGAWWSAVRETVAGEGVPDVFPSVHTAMPALFTLFAFRHREVRVYRWLWPVLAVITAHIVVATLLLRLHWGIDIVAGLVLAAAADRLAAWIARREWRQWRRGRRQPVWEPLFRWQRA